MKTAVSCLVLVTAFSLSAQAGRLDTPSSAPNEDLVRVSLNRPIVVPYSKQPKDFPSARDEIELDALGLSKSDFLIKDGVVITASELVRMDRKEAKKLIDGSHCLFHAVDFGKSSNDISIQNLTLTTEGPRDSLYMSGSKFTIAEKRRYFSVDGDQSFGVVSCLTVDSGDDSGKFAHWGPGSDLASQLHGRVLQIGEKNDPSISDSQAKKLNYPVVSPTPESSSATNAGSAR